VIRSTAMTSATPELPPYLRRFVLPHETVEPASSGALDLYLPASTPAPAVLMVHGGPVPRDREVRPPDWPAYRGYGALLAQAGLVGGMFEHGFVDGETLGTARENIRDAATALRADPRVDPDRFGMWFFSAGGLFMGSALADPAAWGVTAVAGSYAFVGHPDIDDAVLPPATVHAEVSDIPLLLVRPEYDFDWIVTASTELLERCAAKDRIVDVIEVPGGHHGFETVDDTDEARDAIRRSIAWWARALR
jgi:dipeptidyl aminopeptidase/acylaminoacyl peptidase